MAEKLLGAGVNLRVMALGVQERHLIDVQKFDPVLGGVLEENSVNIAAHGHNPVLSEKILEWARKMEKDAIAVGADSINVVGVCCTGNELAMRHGVKLAAHNAQSELILATGAVDCMVVDIQCIWPSLPQLAQCFDTAFITDEMVHIPGARHIEFEPTHADASAQEIVRAAIESFVKRRGKKVDIPKLKTTAFAGLSVGRRPDRGKRVRHCAETGG